MAEGETLAVGVSTRMLEVMDVGSLRTEASQSPRGGRCSLGSGGRDLGSWGLYSCAQSGGWRYVADCGVTVDRGGRFVDEDVRLSST